VGGVKRSLVTSSLIVVVSILLVGPLIAGRGRSVSVHPSVSAPAIAYRDPPTQEQRAMVDWAVDRYLTARLQLPDVTISFPVSCIAHDGRHLAGRYLRTRDEIELCKPSRKLALHELAHAWDDHADVDRDALMAARGLDHWYEEPGRDPIESGGEQLARLVTWGLMDVDITWPSAEHPGQPVNDQPRVLPGMEDCGRTELTELFVLVTGTEPLTPGAALTPP
jgi:hypothetical protein